MTNEENKIHQQNMLLEASLKVKSDYKYFILFLFILFVLNLLIDDYKATITHSQVVITTTEDLPSLLDRPDTIVSSKPKQHVTQNEFKAWIGSQKKQPPKV